MTGQTRARRQRALRHARRQREGAPRGHLTGGDPLSGGRPAAVGHAGRAALAASTLGTRG